MPRTHILARAVIRREDRLLVVQADGRPHTFLPGGHREGGEGLEACLRRELKEELGVAPAIGPYLGTVEHEWARGGTQNYELNHCFAVQDASFPETAPDPLEAHLTFDWVRLDRLGDVSLQPPPLRSLLRTEIETPWWASTVSATADGDRASASAEEPAEAVDLD